MTRWLVMVVVALMALTAAVIAEAGVPADAKPAPMQMQGGMCPMMQGAGMMGQAGNAMAASHCMAAWDGYIYILQNDTLKKLDHNLTEVKSIKLEMAQPAMQGMGMQPHGMMQGGMMSGGGRMQNDDKPGPGSMSGPMGAGPGMGSGSGMMMQGGMMSGGMMQGGMMQGRNAQLAADVKGIYLLRAGQLTVFDHDLNKIASTQITEPGPGSMSGGMGAMSGTMRDGMMSGSRGGMMQGKMQRDGMQQGGMMQGMSCPMMSAGMGDDGPIGLVSSAQRRIAEGSLSITSMWVYPREASVHVNIRDDAGQGVSNAVVSAFLYPKGKPERGVERPVYETGGTFMVPCEFAAPGDYELALRIKRSGMADVLVYQHLSVH